MAAWKEWLTNVTDGLASHQKCCANYQNVFNIVWYSIQPLPLGKSDLTKSPSLDDGIFFGDYKVGVPGMQSERFDFV